MILESGWQLAGANNPNASAHDHKKRRTTTLDEEPFASDAGDVRHTWSLCAGSYVWQRHHPRLARTNTEVGNVARDKNTRSPPMHDAYRRRDLKKGSYHIRGWRIGAAVLLAGSAWAGPTDPPQKLLISEKSFRCMTEMTHIGHFYVDNLLRNLKGTVQVAESPTGGVYPEGTVLQLVPTEVMVKREKGFNAATRDWEFFELDVSPTGSTIRTRGFVSVVNRFGGNCFTCHVKARPEFDLVCSTTHGCDPIPVTIAMSSALQRTDPRCKHDGPVSAEDTAALVQLAEIQKALAAANAAKQ